MPAKVRHNVAWYQDIFPETLGDITKRIQPSDIVYTLGDPQVLGMKADLPCYSGCLLPGVDQGCHCRRPGAGAGSRLIFRCVRVHPAAAQSGAKPQARFAVVRLFYRGQNSSARPPIYAPPAMDPNSVPLRSLCTEQPSANDGGGNVSAAARRSGHPRTFGGDE